MDVEKNRRQALLSWLFVAMLVALCATLGILQYRWIGEVSNADRMRMRVSLQTSLQRISQEFNTDLSAAGSALSPASQTPAELSEQTYALRYARWRNSGRNPRLF